MTTNSTVRTVEFDIYSDATADAVTARDASGAVHVTAFREAGAEHVWTRIHTRGEVAPYVRDHTGSGWECPGKGVALNLGQNIVVWVSRTEAEALAREIRRAFED